MGQSIKFLQSMWAMERRHTDGFERSLDDNVKMILDAGFDGVSVSLSEPKSVDRVATLLKGKAIEGVCYPTSVEGLKPVLELATRIGVTQLNVQPNVRPRSVAECAPYLEGWMKLGEQANFPVYFETHRDRMTTDLFFTLDLLDRYPDLPLLGDLSHFLVGREFAMPIDEANHAYMRRIMENCWAFHGRVASREQVQIEISFPHHKVWVDTFLNWWSYGFNSWRKRAKADATMVFTCELGPQPYAITGRDGNDTTDRWQEALLLRDLVKGVWETGSAG